MRADPTIAARAAALWAEHGATPGGRQLIRETLVNEFGIVPKSAGQYVLAARRRAEHQDPHEIERIDVTLTRHSGLLALVKLHLCECGALATWESEVSFLTFAYQANSQRRTTAKIYVCDKCYRDWPEHARPIMVTMNIWQLQELINSEIARTNQSRAR